MKLIVVALIAILMIGLTPSVFGNIKTDVIIDSITVNQSTIDLVCTDPELKGQTVITGYTVDIDDELFDSIEITDTTTKTCDGSTTNSINISSLTEDTLYNLRLTVSTNNAGDSIDTDTFTTLSLPQTFEITLTDSMSISDSVTIISHFKITLTDSISITDSVIVVHIPAPQVFEIILTDSISITDSVIIIHIPAPQVFEITLTDSISITDSVSVVHIPASGSPFKITLTDSMSITDSVTILLNGEPVGEPQVKRGGGGGDSKWKTKPTFGRDHDNLRQFVTDGFILNGEKITITDNFHTEYPLIELETGVKYKMSAKAYSQRGLKVVEFMFGIPEVGKAHEAESTVEIWLNSENYPLINNVTYYPVDKVITQKDSIINDNVVSFYKDDRCNEIDPMMCKTVIVFLSFNEAPLNKVFGIKAIDQTGRYVITTFNDGIIVGGESLNAPKKEFMAYGKLGLLEMIQIDKKNDMWVSPYGLNYTKNSFGSWIQLTHDEILRPQDDWTVDTRMASYWNDMILLEQVKARLVFDSSEIQKEKFEEGGK